MCIFPSACGPPAQVVLFRLGWPEGGKSRVGGMRLWFQNLLPRIAAAGQHGAPHRAANEAPERLG